MKHTGLQAHRHGLFLRVLLKSVLRFGAPVAAVPSMVEEVVVVISGLILRLPPDLPSTIRSVWEAVVVLLPDQVEIPGALHRLLSVLLLSQHSEGQEEVQG